jgi:PhnB protein
MCSGVQILRQPAEAERVFHALVENGTVMMPLRDIVGVHSGMLVDRFGIPWVINCQKAPAKAA